MRYFADLHIHSPFSRATSKELDLEHLHQWAQLKGLSVVATGDITHPGRLEEIKTKLTEAEEGLYALRREFSQSLSPTVPASCRRPIRFILSGEISTIYKKGGRVRKVHSVIFVPSIAAAVKLQEQLAKIGNITSDGRPILGLDTRDLLETLLQVDPQAVLIPAHIWTPWFSLFGSKSGFDSVEECFGDLTPHIFAMETGLSSDPPMNWRLSQLDRYVLISNSDAHSPANLAREANIFDTELSYKALFDALRDRSSNRFLGTIEFFPEEGKYHADGHRKCGVRFMPDETKAHRGVCPVCGLPLVLGVSYRVDELADRPVGYRPPNAQPFYSLIPLPEVLAEAANIGKTAAKIEERYFHLLGELGSELEILLDRPLADIQRAGGSLLAEAIRRMREGKVMPEPGYDGEYGLVRIFMPGEREKIARQQLLFELPKAEKPQRQDVRKPEQQIETIQISEPPTELFGLDEEQRKAVEHRGTPLLIIAGPGSGKTRTLTHRLAAIIEEGSAEPEEVLAVTFTNRAADEMRERLSHLLGRARAERMTISTLHAFGAEILRRMEEPFAGRTASFSIIEPAAHPGLHESLKPLFEKTANPWPRIAFYKSRGILSDSLPKEVAETEGEAFTTLFRRYEELLTELDAVDLEDLILLPLRLLRFKPEVRRTVLRQFPVVAVDEFQDLSRIQYELIRLFALSARDFCAIGDPDQAIYGFRGAEPRLFERFQEEFPHARVIRLARNYRSTPIISAAAQQMLRRRTVSVESPANAVKVIIHHAVSDRAEAEYIVQTVEQLVGGTGFFSFDSERVDRTEARLAFGDIAVLFRSRAAAPALIEAFHRSGIPYDYADDAFTLDEPLYRLLTAARKKESSALFDDAKNFFGDEEAACSYLAAAADLPADASAETLLSLIMKYLPENRAGEQTARFLDRLMKWAAAFQHEPQRFFDALAVQRSLDRLDPRADRVRLLTLHAAKGLEFSAVFIAACEEGILPHHLGRNDLEEERRLLYVGMTRAKRFLFLTHAKTRLLNGKMVEQEPSHFLSAISDSLVSAEKSRIDPRKKVKQLSLF
ncbi:MAG: UvrD-helicase domain-containing protein [candidate division KSB1 bacterium]|nr:UvrD-helicase domain-containing protein [candidate division KSB1 bacterium]